MSVAQIGRLSPQFTFVHRSGQTTNRARAQDLFLAACRTVDRQVRLPSGPIDCPMDTGSELIATFFSDYSGRTLAKMLFIDSGCASMTMETATGETRQSAIFGSAAAEVSTVDKYLQAILD